MNETLHTDFENARRTSDFRRPRKTVHDESRPVVTTNALARQISPEQRSLSFADLYGRRFAMALTHGHWDAARSITDEARHRLEELEAIDPLDESVYDVDWGCPQNNIAGFLHEAGFYTVRDVIDGLERNQLIEIHGISEGKIAKIRQRVQQAQDQSERHQAGLTW